MFNLLQYAILKNNFIIALCLCIFEATISSSCLPTWQLFCNLYLHISISKLVMSWVLGNCSPISCWCVYSADGGCNGTTTGTTKHPTTIPTKLWSVNLEGVVTWCHMMSWDVMWCHTTFDVYSVVKNGRRHALFPSWQIRRPSWRSSIVPFLFVFWSSWTS